MIKFCSHCGERVQIQIPDGDDKPRAVCSSCAAVFYDNPKIVSACVIAHKGRILLCKRAIEPEVGRWTLPAGFMENDETPQEAAEREAWEESRAKVRQSQLYAMYSFPQINQVYVIYRGELTGFNVGNAGFESDNVGLFAPADIPWDTLAFSRMNKPLLEQYLHDSEQNQFPVHSVDVRDLTLWGAQ